jgi:hypothetical protein
MGTHTYRNGGRHIITTSVTEIGETMPPLGNPQLASASAPDLLAAVNSWLAEFPSPLDPDA